MNSLLGSYIWYSVTVHINLIQIRLNSLVQTKYRSYLVLLMCLPNKWKFIETWFKKHMEPRSFWIQITGQKMCFTPTKTLVCYILSFIMFSPKHTVEAAEPPQSYFWAHYPWFCVRARSRKSRYNEVDFGTVLYNFIIINFHWKWLTMAPEAHGAQVLQDSDCRPKNMICPH